MGSPSNGDGSAERRPPEQADAHDLPHDAGDQASDEGVKSRRTWVRPVRACAEGDTGRAKARSAGHQGFHCRGRHQGMSHRPAQRQACADINAAIVAAVVAPSRRVVAGFARHGHLWHHQAATVGEGQAHTERHEKRQEQCWSPMPRPRSHDAPNMARSGSSSKTLGSCQRQVTGPYHGTACAPEPGIPKTPSQ
jgi:hypothetical protein